MNKEDPPSRKIDMPRVSNQSRPRIGQAPTSQIARPMTGIHVPIATGRPADARKSQDRRDQHSPRRPATNLGDQLLAKLEVAHASGNAQEFERLLALALATNLPHPLTIAARNAKIEEERKAREEARRVEQKERDLVYAQADMVFKTAMGQVRRFLTLARNAVAANEDAQRFVDAIETQVCKAVESDRKERDVSTLLALADTSESELFELTLMFYVDKRVVPGPSKEIAGVQVRSEGSFVTPDRFPRKGQPVVISMDKIEVVTLRSAFPKPNAPIKETGAGGAIRETFSKIIYNEDDQFGDRPFLVFPDDRHQVEASVDDSGPRTFMGETQIALMERMMDRWVYTPFSSDDLQLTGEPRLGSFARGFVLHDRLPILTFTVIVNGVLVGASLTQALLVVPFRHEVTLDLLEDDSIVRLYEVEIPKDVLESRHRKTTARPTENRCVIIPEPPRSR